MSADPLTVSPRPLRRLLATRYVTALREGGSVPAVVEADDGALYVAKFRAAAQGGRALAAELIVGELARAAGLRLPELALIEIDAALGRSEPHMEIQELLIASAGINLAMGYLAGAIGYDVAARRPIDGALASRIVALDVFAVNVDRTARNPNLLWQGGELWLIDHGAALYWHHGWDGQDDNENELVATAARPFARVSEHVLLPFADQLPAAGAALAAALDDERIALAVDAVPDLWLEGPGDDRLRAAYGTWLRARRAALPKILDEANRVRASRV
ncbi:MAG TPA: HipA family kinase [Polyangia bacterium]|nr:HipA family kinase [Polyangia bacterium]